MRTRNRQRGSQSPGLRIVRPATSCWTKLAKESQQDQSAGSSDASDQPAYEATVLRVARCTGGIGVLEGRLSFLGKGVGFSSVIPVTCFPFTADLGIGLDSCPWEEEVTSFYHAVYTF